MTNESLETGLRDACITLTAPMQVPAGSLEALLEKVPVGTPAGHRFPRAMPVGAALLAAAAVTATVLVAVQLGDRTQPRSNLPGTGVAAAGPYPSSDYFLATRNQPFHPPQGHPPQIAVVRAIDGKTVATLPVSALDESNSPVLSPDGSRVYATWGANPTRMGYYDLTTGKTVILDSRPGLFVGPTISADGTTLAYEWDGVLGSPDTSTSIVVRNLQTGISRLITHAPAGPQVLPMALSPNGTELAVVPTATMTRPLLLVSTRDPEAFRHPTQIRNFGCGTHNTTEPTWTVHALYTLSFCGQASNLIAVDPKTHAARIFHHFKAPGILAYAAIPSTNADLIAIADQEQASPSLQVYDPRHGWSATPVTGSTGIPAITSD